MKCIDCVKSLHEMIEEKLIEPVDSVKCCIHPMIPQASIMGEFVDCACII